MPFSNHPAPLEPLIIPTWPTCTNCLAWSNENLAVGGGEVIHFLTPRHSYHITSSNSTSDSENTAQHPLWHHNTIRVNEFTEDEWPHQEVASITHFSIGEEQSLSTVSGLEWSPPGPGIHRRSVLGVLTTNLVLSLWETNGNLGQWKRGCVVNTALKNEVQDSETEPFRRRASRVRAFTWLQPLVYGGGSKWGLCYLAVADDNDVVTMLNIRKLRQDVFGEWDIRIVSQHKIERKLEDQAKSERASHLTQILIRDSRISSLGAGNWKWSSQDGAPGEAHCQVHVEKGKAGSLMAYHLTAIRSSTSAAGEAVMRFKWESLPMASHIVLADQIPPGSIFDKALRSPCDEFNKTHNLHGDYRVKFWGTAWNVNHSRAAACVTLHPRRMIEYSTPALEKSLLVFERTDPVMFPNRTRLPEVEVQKNILSFIATVSQTDRIYSDLERKVAYVASQFTQLTFPHVLGPADWFQPLQLEDGGIDASMVTDGMLEPSQPTEDMQVELNSLTRTPYTEQCEICSANINFTLPPATALCDNGHPFTRCNLSFIAIQEPGISKYCSECSRQFLQQSKLEPHGGPSFVRDLFLEFDVCPYCQGKFRG